MHLLSDLKNTPPETVPLECITEYNYWTAPGNKQNQMPAMGYTTNKGPFSRIFTTEVGHWGNWEQKQGWVLYRHKVTLTELGHGGLWNRKQGWIAQKRQPHLTFSPVAHWDLRHEEWRPQVKTEPNPASDLMTHLIKNGPYQAEKSHCPIPIPSHSEHIWLSSSQSVNTFTVQCRQTSARYGRTRRYHSVCETNQCRDVRWVVVLQWPWSWIELWSMHIPQTCYSSSTLGFYQYEVGGAPLMPTQLWPTETHATKQAVRSYCWPVQCESKLAEPSPDCV